MAEWMGWAIMGVGLVACLLVAMWIGAEHAPGESMLRRRFNGKDAHDDLTAVRSHADEQIVSTTFGNFGGFGSGTSGSSR